MKIAYPVYAVGDGTERIADATGQVLGAQDKVDAINAGYGHCLQPAEAWELNALREAIKPVRAQLPNIVFNNGNFDIGIVLTPTEAKAIKRAAP